MCAIDVAEASAIAVCVVVVARQKNPLHNVDCMMLTGACFNKFQCLMHCYWTHIMNSLPHIMGRAPSSYTDEWVTVSDPIIE